MTDIEGKDGGEEEKLSEISVKNIKAGVVPVLTAGGISSTFICTFCIG